MPQEARSPGNPPEEGLGGGVTSSGHLFDSRALQVRAQSGHSAPLESKASSGREREQLMCSGIFLSDRPREMPSKITGSLEGERGGREGKKPALYNY